MTQLLASSVYMLTVGLKLASHAVCKNEGACLVSMWSPMIVSHNLLNFCLIGAATVDALHL